jgi:hypothetical protein
VPYQGVANTALGSATLAVSNNLLTVGNLGSSGQDGVSIALPSFLTALDVEWQDFDPSNSLPVGYYIQENAVGTANGITNGVLGTLTMTKFGTTNYLLSANFSPIGASNYLVQAYFQGALVAQMTNLNVTAAVISFNSPVQGGPSRDYIIGFTAHGAPIYSFSGHGYFQSVEFDDLVCTPLNVPSYSPAALAITASHVPSITITSENESLVYQGLTNTSLGNATLAVSGNQFTVGNLGASGQDGVSIALPRYLSGLDVHWQNLEQSNTLPVGSYIQEHLIGTANGITNGLLGTTTVTKTGSTNYLVSADFSPMGASNYLVQVYVQGVLVAQMTNQNGASLAQIYGDDPLLDLGYLGGFVYSGPLLVCLPPCYDIPPIGCTTCTNRNIPDPQGPVELVINPISLQSPTLTGIGITASQVPGITITSENATVPYQGLAITALGSATLAVSNNLLTVGNLGSSGQDGLLIPLSTNLTALDVEWQDFDPSNSLPVGYYIQENAVGTANGITNGVLGTLTMTKTGTTNYLLSANFSAIGASNYLVQAYFQEALVAQMTNQNGASLLSFYWTGPGGPGRDTVTAVNLKNGSVTYSYSGHGYFQSVEFDDLVCTPLNVPSYSPTAMAITASQVPSISITAENVSVQYQGFSNTALGSATLAVSGSGLIVTNLGSSGQDGVEIGLGAAQGFALHWQDFDPSNSLPVGAYLEEELFGTGGTVTNGLLGILQVIKQSSSNFLYTANFAPMGASELSAQLYRVNQPVGNPADGENGPVSTSPSWPRDFEYINTGGGDVAVLSTYNSVPKNINLINGGSGLADAVDTTPISGPQISTVTSVELFASGIPQIIITNESATVIYGGVNHSSLGNAMLNVQSNQLTVGNLGSSGQDGVEIALPSVTTWGAEWEPLDLAGTLPVGAYLQIQETGTANGVTNGLLGTFTMTKTPSNSVVAADFSPIGAINFTAQLYNGTNQVKQATGLANGPMCYCLQLTGITNGLGWRDTETIYVPGVGSFYRHSIILSLIGFQPDDSDAVTADSIVISLPNVATTGIPTSLLIQASQIPSMVITNEIVLPLTLNSTLTGKNLQLQWFGTGGLQVSPNLNSWTDLTNAVSPYLWPVLPTNQFYRIKQPMGDEIGF